MNTQSSARSARKERLCKIGLSGLLVSLSILTTHSVSAGVIAIESELYLQAQARSNGSVTVSDIDSDSQGATTNDLSASASVTATTPGAFVEVSGSGTASWVNAAAGQVKLNDFGFTSLHNSGSGFVDLGGWHGIPVWSYTFLADVSGLFSMDWDVFVQPSSDSTFGLGGFRFSLTGGGGGQSLFKVGAIGGSQSGTVTRNIVAGNTYTAFIESEIGLVGGIGTTSRFMDGTFDWSMDSGAFESVPEPTSSGLFLLALLGLAVTRKNTNLTAS